MSAPKFTPGPWRVDPGQHGAMDGTIVADEPATIDRPYPRLKRWQIAYCVERNPYSRDTDRQPERGAAEANATLIAAAPDLYAALTTVEVAVESLWTATVTNAKGRDDNKALKTLMLLTIRAALAKAEGRS